VLFLAAVLGVLLAAAWIGQITMSVRSTTQLPHASAGDPLPTGPLKVASTLAFGTSLYLTKGPAVAMIAALIGAGCALAWFPIWRRYVDRHRDSWTFGNPASS